MPLPRALLLHPARCFPLLRVPAATIPLSDLRFRSKCILLSLSLSLSFFLSFFLWQHFFLFAPTFSVFIIIFLFYLLLSLRVHPFSVSNVGLSLAESGNGVICAILCVCVSSVLLSRVPPSVTISIRPSVFLGVAVFSHQITLRALVFFLLSYSSFT